MYPVPRFLRADIRSHVMAMGWSFFRLLAAFLLIFAAPTLLRGQDAAAERSSVDRSSSRSRALAPEPWPLRYPVPTAPVGTSPYLPPRYPGAPGVVGRQDLPFWHLVHAAGIIFAGRVTFVGQAASSSGPDPASTTVTFQVEHAIRGTSQGQNLTIHEWAGLRLNGERYRVGERVLLFLYSPSKLGLTSPVAGAMGRFAINSRGEVVMNAQILANLGADPILGGKTVVPYAEFALAVRRSSGEE
jgi:hypothetical protein